MTPPRVNRCLCRPIVRREASPDQSSRTPVGQRPDSASVARYLVSGPRVRRWRSSSDECGFSEAVSEAGSGCAGRVARRLMHAETFGRPKEAFGLQCSPDAMGANGPVASRHLHAARECWLVVPECHSCVALESSWKSWGTLRAWGTARPWAGSGWAGRAALDWLGTPRPCVSSTTTAISCGM